jgi:PST family polysaccharide transporter
MKNQIETSTLKRLGDNFISLVILQLINYVLPLLLIPYLIRVLGIEGFGIYSFIFAIVMYGVKMSDYGFELSATYHISLHREEPKKINEIFSSVFMIKFAIALFYLIAILLAILFVEKLFIYKELLFCSFGIFWGYILFPVWFFQGIEKMRYIMLLNSLSKFLFIVSVFLFVKESDDLYLLLLLNSIATLIVGLMAFFIAIKQFDIQLTWQSWEKVSFYLKDGWYIFTSKIAVEFYTTVNIIILGFFVSPLMVGYYAIAEKLIHAIGSLLNPLVRTVYPYLVKVYDDSSKNFMKRNRQLSLVILMIMLPVSVFVMFYAEWILSVVTGNEVSAISIQSLEILSLALVVYLYGGQFTNILVITKETKLLNKILFSSAIINVILAPVLIHFYGVIGLACLNVFIAFWVTLTKGYYIYIKKGEPKT